MNGIISSSDNDVKKLREILNSVPSMEGLELSSSVTTKKAYFYGNKKSKYKSRSFRFGCEAEKYFKLHD